jgi:hypothetical protein
MIEALKLWWQRWRKHPYVLIDTSGRLTCRPQVHVSVCGNWMIQGVYTYDDTDQGNARAEMYGRGLAQAMGRRLIDNRPAQLPSTPANKGGCDGE